MKPCAKNRKPITWLAVGALDVRAEQTLRAHLETCEGCRRYRDEISLVTQTLAATTPGPEIETSETFHRGVVSRLRAERPTSLAERVVTPLRSLLLNWRVGGAVLGATAVVALSFFSWRSQSRPPGGGQAAVVVNEKSDLDPTISNYQTVAHRSLERLDELLSQQGNRTPSSGLIYTASTLARGDVLED